MLHNAHMLICIYIHNQLCVHIHATTDPLLAASVKEFFQCSYHLSEYPAEYILHITLDKTEFKALHSICILIRFTFVNK